MTVFIMAITFDPYVISEVLVPYPVVRSVATVLGRRVGISRSCLLYRALDTRACSNTSTIPNHYHAVLTRLPCVPCNESIILDPHLR